MFDEEVAAQMSESALKELQEASIKKMMKVDMNIETARPFQVEAIRAVHFHSKNTLLVQMTGNGKSAVPAGALIMSGGIAITFVPLLSVGTGQASSAAAKYGKSLKSFHVDDWVGKDRTALVGAVDAVADRSSKKPIMLYLSLQSITGKDNPLFSAIMRAAERGVLSGVNYDEIHRIGSDASLRSDWEGFDTTTKALFNVQHPPTIIAMTATLSGDLLRRFETATGLDCSGWYRVWGELARRNIKIRITFGHSSTRVLKKILGKYLAAGQKVVVYTNHAARAPALLEHCSSALASGGGWCCAEGQFHAACLTGATGPIMKAYLTDAWEAEIADVGRVFESINLAILIATDAGDVGLDSSGCMGVFQEGPFSSKAALVQKMGRIRSKSNSGASLTIFMSVALWAKLLLRIRSGDGAGGEVQRQERDLAAVLRLLLPGSPLCLHQAIEGEFRDPEAGASASGRCGTACPCCDPSLGLAASPVDRAAAERNLRVHFNCTPRSPSQDVVSCLTAAKLSVFPGSDTNAAHANRLVLQLISAGILAYHAENPKEGAPGNGAVLLSFAVEGGDLAYRTDARWRHIKLTGQDPDSDSDMGTSSSSGGTGGSSTPTSSDSDSDEESSPSSSSNSSSTSTSSESGSDGGNSPSSPSSNSSSNGSGVDTPREITACAIGGIGGSGGQEGGVAGAELGALPLIRGRKRNR